MESTREHRVDRFVTFADAVVAIAITLLAIPLLELADEADQGFEAWFGASALPFLGLAISFAVIARLWWSNHRVFEHVERWNRPLVWVTFVWLFTIVLASIATAVTTRIDTSVPENRWAFVFYVGVMVASGLTLFLQSLIVHRHPELTDGRDDDALRRVVVSAETTVGFAIVLLLGVLVPGIGYFGFFVLAILGRLDDPIVRLLQRRRR